MADLFTRSAHDLRAAVAEQFKPGADPDKPLLIGLMAHYLEPRFDEAAAAKLLTEFASIAVPADDDDFVVRVELAFDLAVVGHVLQGADDGTLALYKLAYPEDGPTLVFEETESGEVMQFTVSGTKGPVKLRAVAALILDEWLEGRPKGVTASIFVNEAANGAIARIERESVH